MICSHCFKYIRISSQLRFLALEAKSSHYSIFAKASLSKKPPPPAVAATLSLITGLRCILGGIYIGIDVSLFDQHTELVSHYWTGDRGCTPTLGLTLSISVRRRGTSALSYQTIWRHSFTTRLGALVRVPALSLSKRPRKIFSTFITADRLSKRAAPRFLFSMASNG